MKIFCDFGFFFNWVYVQMIDEPDPRHKTPDQKRTAKQIEKVSELTAAQSLKIAEGGKVAPPPFYPLQLLTYKQVIQNYSCKMPAGAYRTYNIR